MYNKNSWSKTSNALPIIFCCKKCLFWFFSFYKKAATSYLWGFYVHFTLYKSEKYMFCTLLICYQFLWLWIIVDKKGVITDSFLVVHIFFFFGKGDLMGWVGGGLRMRETLYKTNQFLLWSLVVVHI